MTQDELNVLVAELRMDATSSEYPAHDQRVDRAADEIERLSAEVSRLYSGIRKHRDAKGDDRCWLDDLALYRLLPEGDKGWEDTLPMKEEFLESCERYWRQRQSHLQLPTGCLTIRQLEDEVSRLRADRDRLEAVAVEQAELRGRAEAERDSVVGSYYTCRKVLQEAGIPCQFGKDGEPTTDEGTGRDLADCVKTLAERLKRLKAAEVEREKHLCPACKSALAAGLTEKGGGA